MSVILDISLGVLVVFLFLSLVVSAVGEAISTWLSLRYKQLRLGIASLMQSDQGQVEQFFRHPLIKALGRGGNGKPSYVRSETFARVMLEQVRNRAARLDLPAFLSEALKRLPDGEAKQTLQELQSKGFEGASALTEKLQALPAGEAKQSLESLLQRWLETSGSLARQLESLPDGDLKAVLRALAADGDYSAAGMEKKLASYYDATMERVTGWYKRRMQLVLFAVGFVVCAVLNVDVFVMVPLLHHDAHLRQQLAGVAVQVGSQANAPTLAELDARLEKISLPFGWQSDAASGQGASGAASAGKGLAKLRGGPQADGLWWLRKTLGLLVCALAASFGAPFWFDLLSKVVSIRSALPVPAGPKPACSATPAAAPTDK